MRVHIFDQQLGLGPGHPAIYDEIVAAEMRRRRIPAALYRSVSHVHQSPASREAAPLFTGPMWERVGEDPVVWPLEDFSAANAHIYKDLAGLGARDLTQDDIAFFPNLTENQIDGIRQWIVGIAPANRPTLVLKLSYLTFAMPFLQKRQNKEMIPLLYRFAIRGLKAAHPRTAFCTETEEMADAFCKMTDLPIPLLPLPLTMEGGVAVRAPGAPLRVAFLGSGHMIKGFHLLPEIVARARAAAPDTQFVAHAWENSPDAQRLAGMTGVRVIAGEIGREAYMQLFSGIDIVLMPYSAALYGWNSSGVFTEALSAGKVVVVPDNTWLSRQVAKFGGGGVSFAAHEAGAISGALIRALNDFSALSQQAMAARMSWNARHGASNFGNEFLALAAGVR